MVGKVTPPGRERAAQLQIEEAAADHEMLQQVQRALRGDADRVRTSRHAIEESFRALRRPIANDALIRRRSS